MSEPGSWLIVLTKYYARNFLSCVIWRRGSARWGLSKRKPMGSKPSIYKGFRALSLYVTLVSDFNTRVTSARCLETLVNTGSQSHAFLRQLCVNLEWRRSTARNTARGVARFFARNFEAPESARMLAFRASPPSPVDMRVPGRLRA